jgi:signal transduction histidine kinase
MMELHDGVIQSIYAIGMQVDLMTNTTQDAVQLEGLRRIISGLNTVIEDIRRYIQNLRSMDDNRQSFAECIEDLLHRIHVPSKLKIVIKVPKELRPPLSPTAFEAVCQIVHEALSNVVRHADATQVEVDAVIKDDVFTVMVDDNGSGFEVSERDSHGLGLRNIQTRARLHGGQVVIDSMPGDGTRLTINVPIKPY